MSEKELNGYLEQLMLGIIRGIARIFKGTYWGIKKLKKKKNIIFFLIFVVISIITYFLRSQFRLILAPIYIQYLIYYMVFLTPVLFLFILGNSQDRLQAKFIKIFEEINFVGSDKKYPYLVNQSSDGKKVIFTFKSMIPLQDWKKSIDKLETGLDCNILLIQEGKSKKLVELITVPSDCRIPTMISWKNNYMPVNEGVISVGESALGQVTVDLNKTPHILIAGETGSGKSVILRTIIKQFILKVHKIYMIDFKGGVEFGVQYEKYGEVITDRQRAITLLTQLVEEMNHRLELFRKTQVKNLAEYNKKTSSNLQRIGIFCDEVAEMLDRKGATKELKEELEVLNGLISSLARLSRATGINLILGIQRPDANVLTGQIKNNIPVRICGRFADKSASEIVLGNTSAVDLPQIQGRFLYKLGNDTSPFQAYYFDDDTMLEEEETQKVKIDEKELTKKKKVISKNRKSMSETTTKSDNRPKNKPNTVKEKISAEAQRKPGYTPYVPPECEAVDESVFDEVITWSVDEKKEANKKTDVSDGSDFNFDYSDFCYEEDDEEENEE